MALSIREVGEKLSQAFRFSLFKTSAGVNRIAGFASQKERK